MNHKIRPPNPDDPSQELITALLADISDGDSDALNQLFSLVYGQLKAIAHKRLRLERKDHTLNTTALVHEAYVRLVDQDRAQWENRSHFFAIAAQAMRRILVNYAESRRAVKRGGGASKVPLELAQLGELPFSSEDPSEEILALNDALQRLEAFNERGCRVVEYRFLVGMTYDEIANVMGISAVTVRRAWLAAKSWLKHYIEKGTAN